MSFKAKKQAFGLLSCGGEASLFTVSNGSISFSATDYGCHITSVLLPCKNGGFDDVVLGFSTLDGYTRLNREYLGSIIGRYSNRISGAEFTLNGERYRLGANNRGNCLHGGARPYHGFLWEPEIFQNESEAGVCFRRRSPDGEQGFPGDLDVEIFYSLNRKNQLILRYRAKTSKETPVSITNHVYFNLKGERGGNIGAHNAVINSGLYLEVDENLVPTGNILKVEGSVFDFRKQREIGRDFENPALSFMNGGYDAAYCFEGTKETDSGRLPLLAVVKEPETGRSLACYSNQNCMQFYTSCNLPDMRGKNGAAYSKYGAFCLETQGYNNAPNIKSFPDPFLKPGEVYESVTVYEFGI